MQEKGKDGAEASKKSNLTFRLPVTGHKRFIAPDGSLDTGWNEGRLVYAMFFPDRADAATHKVYSVRERPNIPKMCVWRQLDTVDGDALFDAIARAARKMKRETSIDLYDYVRDTVVIPDVANQNVSEPVADVTDRTIRDCIKAKKPEVVLAALAYLKTSINGLRDEAGEPIACEYTPTDEESLEAVKQFVGNLLEGLFDCGYKEPAATVVSFLEVVFKSIELGRHDKAITDDMVRTVVDAVDANVLAYKKMLWRLEAEREKAMGVTLLPPDDYDWPFEDVGGIRRPQML
ncbi:MAG: hypothetical protein PUE02_02405 [Eggerthellaceae bacterium]|nr:hypothetical protein [Eggerthellaceae bacterium]